MQDTSPSAYGFLGTVEAIEYVLRTFSRMSGAISIQATSFLIGAAIMAGLKHPVRRRIHEPAVRLPGDHFRSVARSLDIAVGTARYHLAALLRDGLVYREDTNGRARYYVKSGAADVNLLYSQHWEFRDVRLRLVGALRLLEQVNRAKISNI